jgi:glycopeptide antibiotics resistance protein
MKRIYIIIIVIVVAATAVSGYKGVVLAANQSEEVIHPSGDPCGGTGGKGQIVSVGSNTFILERHDGKNQIVNFTDQTTIKTSAGSGSASDLKTGERVTLVGAPNRDGSFTADTVAVCSRTQENGAGQANPLTARKEHTNYKKVSGAINVATVLVFVLIWLGITAFLRLKKKKSLVYLLFFTIFYVYIVKVLDYTLFQFQSLLLLKHFMPDLMLSGQEAGKNMNLIPLITLTLEDLKTSLLNILMLIPFGFGLPIITNFRMRKIVVIGTLFSIVIEFLQLITGLLAKITFRIADINDVIFNTVGVAIGYILFVGFVRIYRRMSHNWKISANPFLRYIAERPQIDK